MADAVVRLTAALAGRYAIERELGTGWPPSASPVIPRPSATGCSARPPRGLDVWLFVVPFAVGLVILDELRKLARRRLSPPACG